MSILPFPRNNLCVEFGGLGTTLNGCMAEFVSVSSHKVIKIPDTMSFEEAAFIEPLACVVHGMNRLQMQVGNRVLLFGVGAMGLQLVQAFTRAGASELVVVDISQVKLVALQLGATKGILSKNIDMELNKTASSYYFDIVVDVTGIPSVIQKSFEFMGPGSKFLQFGVAPPNAKITINPFDVYNQDWTIIGSMALDYTYLSAFHWIKEGRINLKPLISSFITLEQAIEFIKNPKKSDMLKVQIKF